MNIPTATYRLQFRNGMTFNRATALVPYLKRLGISHLYASPVFTATTGSTHGYDVTNANEIDPSIGGRTGFEKLSDSLKQNGLGLILDIVPNHMAASLENAWWKDVIEHGQDSTFARHFDIDWSRRLTLPVLGKDFEEAVDSDEISIARDPETGKPVLQYFESSFPLKPASYEGRDDDLLQSHSRETILALHERQPYRLMCWREARRNLSYRRFFEVTGLAGVRVEDEKVFNDTHRLILELVRSGIVDGLRVDHVDGLADPKGYLERLRREAGPDCYITVEKILGLEESIPAEWPVSGTTGYEFISALSDVFTDNDKLSVLEEAYEHVNGETIDRNAELRKAKLLMVDRNFEGEFTTLLALALGILKMDEDGVRLSIDALRNALRELVIAFPVYRTYGNDEGLPAASDDMLSSVVTAILEGPNSPDANALKALQSLLRGDAPSGFEKTTAEFRTRFQQLTGPLMAKSIEDTLFYRQNMALALNEVGAEPLAREYSLERFHAEMAKRLEEQPNGISTTSTHDTKRGEDARARLYALTEVPELWRDAFSRWQQMNSRFKTELGDGLVPEPPMEWLLYQALVGAWPDKLEPTDRRDLSAFEERFLAYVEKAIREAKLETNWGDSNEPYEAAVISYARNLVAPENSDFLRDFRETISPIITAGLSNSLSQTLIKLMAPGVPDIYQGCEGLDLSLVDPDNRREPDFAALERQLASLASDDLVQAGSLNPAFKQKLIMQALLLRRKLPQLFQKGSYIPLHPTGEIAHHFVCFAREHGSDAVIVAAPRLMMPFILGGEAEVQPALVPLPATLAHGRYVDLLSGRECLLNKTIDLKIAGHTADMLLLRKL